MRIIAGTWRGRALAAPDGKETRPTAARAREALFSMLTSALGTFEGLAVADLFAGTGALGLEALSRGAERAAFVENDRAALTALRRNISALGAAAQASVFARPAPAIGPPPFKADLVFLDAPYEQGLTAPTLSALRERDWLTGSSWLSAEVGAKEPLPAPGYELVRERVYGKARIVLLRCVSS